MYRDSLDYEHWKNMTGLMKSKRQWKRIGERLVSVLAVVSDKLKDENAIQDYEIMPYNKRRPDLIMNEDIGIECKNWDPKAKTEMNSNNLKDYVIERFEGDKEWVKKKVGPKKWKRKILVIPKLQYGYDERKCKKLIKKHDIEVIDGFPYVSEDPEHFKGAEESLYKKFKKRKMEGRL